jgi:hypothetical protein
VVAANGIRAILRAWLRWSSEHHTDRFNDRFSVTCALSSSCHGRPRSHALVAAHPEFGEGSTAVRWLAEAPVAVPTGLPSDAAISPAWLLTLIQGYRQTVEYALQAALLSARRDAPLVAGSDLLVHCNNVRLSAATLLRFVAKYPHRTRALVRSSDNAMGYRCGHLHAIATLASVWRAYEAVLFAHPDVYLLPRALHWLGGAMRAANASGATFIVTNMLWLASPTSSNTPANHPSRRVAGGFFGTDLFVFRPPLLRASAWQRVCATATDESSYYGKPEHRLWRLINDQHLAHSVVGNRTTSIVSSGSDAYGVWHSHEPDKIARLLAGTRDGARREGKSSGRLRRRLTELARGPQWRARSAPETTGHVMNRMS